MDVGIVTTAATKGGLTRYCTTLADGLARAGHDVTLYAPARLAETPPFRQVVTPANAWKAALEVRRLAKRHDLLHVQPVDGAPVALLGGRPTVVTVNGDDILTDDRVDRALKARALASARRVLPNSRYTAALLAERFPRVRAPVEVLPPPIAPPVAPDFAVADSLGLARFVLSVGNLVPRKGFDTLISAGARIGLPVVIVGRGADEARLERIAAESGADARFLGDPGDAALEGLYRRATFFALLSRAEANGRTVEGFGMVIAEAMRHTVALSTSHGGMTDATHPGLIVSDGVAAAERMAALLDDEAAYRAAKRACAERYASEFDLRVVLPRYVAAYRAALA